MPEQKRKLAAIMFTDIAGYTELSGKDETKALALLDLQKQTLTPTIEKYNGTLHKEVGDGLLFTFPTVTEAVKCGIEIQKKTKPIENLNLRIGIHEGEITLKDGDALGDDVNVASRIERFAAIGGIAVSGKIQMNLSSLPEFELKFIGKPQLKGVSQEVKVYCITSHGLPKTDLSKVSAKLESEKKLYWNIYSFSGILLTILGVIFWVSVSFFGIGIADETEVPAIAILPFENKGEPQDDFYAYGISSDLITDVTGAGMIRVASLGDIEKLEFRSLENSELAKKLIVRYVAKGTLWKMDSIFQLSMEIFDTKESKVVYNKRWQTGWKKLSSIKDDLSNNILNTLKVEVYRGLSDHIVSVNPDAYELYLKAKHKYEKRASIDDVEIVRGLLKKAIEFDVNLIPAKILLGLTYMDMGEYDKAMQFYIPALEQAEIIEDKPSTALSLRYIGGNYRHYGDFDKALDFFNSSLELSEELNDKNGIGLSINSIGIIYWEKGNYDKALEYYHRALDIQEKLNDKSEIGIYLSNIGFMFCEKGNYDKASEYFNRSLKILEESGNMDGFGLALNNFGINYYYKGDYERAKSSLEKSLSIQKEIGSKYAQLETSTFLNLANKRLGKDYDAKKIYSLINGDENIELYNNYHLYELLEDKSYLETAYNQVQERADAMDEKLKEKFLNYPIPKQIVEEWEKVVGGS